ncbi:uncharacterized protein LOC113290886 [Papaver somniferum]|uniref:uncharacterized protein LOC113290886 n=1 Tax=Papaver somniferum TaxID=3469 RepID=UPI000E6FAE72|nr:uncharacterized protein LOC113290886 [Papaver somniferum]
MATCAACHSSDYLVDSCSYLHAFQESRFKQANALYHKQEQPLFSDLHPGWRNHPNFSWSKGPVKGGTTSNNQGYSYPRNPQRFASLEIKLGQFCDALNEREKGKLPSQPQKIQKSAFQASTSACNESSHNQVNAVTTLRSGKVVDNNNSTDVNASLPCFVDVAPFPQRLVHQKAGNQYNEILEIFKRVNINIPFLEEIKQMPTYAKFLKDLCTEKRKLHVHKRAFLTEQLGLGELKPTPVTLQLTDRSVEIPRGIVEDVLIKVDKFFFPVDFIVLDIQPVKNPDNHIPVILGHPFLATQQPIDCDDAELHEINMIESLIQDSLPDILAVDPLQACLDNIDLDLFDSKYISEVHSLLESVPPMDIAKWKNAVEPLPLTDAEYSTSLVEPHKPDLKPLPDTLKYAFLGSSDTLFFIIASCLNTKQESKLLEVLKDHKEALGWTISDLKGAVLGQRVDKLPYMIYYASKTLNVSQLNYSTTEKNL